jgi:hypothetical protein
MSGAARAVMVLIALVILVIILRLVGQRRLRSKYALMWIVIGAGTVVLAAFPAIVDAAADRLGIAYPPALLLVAACTVLLLIAIHYSWELSRLEARTRRLAEEIAILRQRTERTASAPDDEDG